MSLHEKIEARRIARAHAAGDHSGCDRSVCREVRRFTARDNSGAIYGRDAA